MGARKCWIVEDTPIFILTIFGVFLGVLFNLFVIVMFYDQISCILSCTSTIDKLQKVKTKSTRTGWENLKFVFTGRKQEGFSIWWLLPLDFPSNLVLEEEYA